MITYPSVGLTTHNHFIEESGGEEAIAITSESTTHHAASYVVNAQTGTGSALNLVSQNRETTTLQVSGKETGKGTIKVTHENGSGSATGDKESAAISIDLQKGTETNTACQGISMTCTTSSATGAWLTIRNEAKALLTRIKSTGQIEIREGKPESFEANCFAIYVESGKLFVKLGAGAAKQIVEGL